MKKTYEEIAKNKDHKAMIENPDLWPNMILPVKRVAHGNLQLGFINPINNLVVYLGNIYFCSTNKFIEYLSIDEMLKDGWIVD